MRSETVNAPLPPRVSQKKAARQVHEGRLSKISCQCIPEPVAKLVGRTSPTEIRKLCLRDLLATILATLSVRQQRLHPSWPEWLTQPIRATAGLAYTLPRPGRAAHILGGAP